MSYDRFIEFEVPPPPDPQWQAVLKLIGEVIEDFFSGAGTIVWDGDASRWFISLPGEGRWALRRVFPESPRAQAASTASPLESRERWIEVCVTMGDGLIVDVLTRHADDFTNALATALAKSLLRMDHAKPMDGAEW